jgi:TolB-like protein/DNA-binding winged helix-turn-helix (wHTH) protein/Tfp pilus assembly protein PilF
MSFAFIVETSDSRFWIAPCRCFFGFDASKDSAILLGRTDEAPLFFRRLAIRLDNEVLFHASPDRRAKPVDTRTPTTLAPFQIADHRVDPSTLRVTGAGKDGRLEAKAMQVLVYLAEHPGRVVSRAELEERLWPGRVVTEDAVTNTIAKLRRVFGDDARHPRVVETVPKSGYRLIAGVTPIPEPQVRRPTASLSGSGAQTRRWRPALGWPAGTLAILLVVIAAWGLLARLDKPYPRNGPLTDKPAVAVLPFENLGPSPEQDYFAHGITADLITDLSKVSGLLVIAPGSVFAYKESGAGPTQISSELDVDYVVMGSVQRSADLLRVNVQLIDAMGERALWGERYDGAIQDVFDVQDRLTAAVIEALEVELVPIEKESLARRPTASIAAYDHYLRGLSEHGHRSKDQNISAKAQFQRAIELDPTFAQAYAGLALAHSRDAIDGWTETPSQSLQRAAELAATAAGMDPLLPQVHFVTGQVDLFRGRHLEAIEAAQRAIRVDPNYADAFALTAWILNYAGRPDEALAALEKAMRLNPRPPASYLEILGEIRFVQRRYDESASVFRQVLDINPDYTRARMWLAAALAHAGAGDNASWEADELMVSTPGLTLARLDAAFPFKDPRQLDVLLSGLREAGVPE